MLLRLSWRDHSADWITVGVLLVLFFFYFEYLQPFYRQFRLDDPSLQHPFAHVERVTDNWLYVLSMGIPLALMAVVALFRAARGPLGQDRPGQVPLHLTFLGLWMAVLLAAIATDILKVWIGNPRPDFLERCKPVSGTPKDVFVGIEVCSSPLGLDRLADGMKSTPLGHSSIAFAGMFYLYRWLGADARLAKSWFVLLAKAVPLMLAAYIAFSRTQDYRHHFKDVFLGLALGVGVANMVYDKYHGPK